MTSKTMRAGALLAACLFATNANASSPCTSTFQTLQSLFQILGPEIAEMSCARQGDTSDACLQNYEDGVERALEIRDIYNAANDGPGRVGPRRFGLDNQDNSTVAAGNVKTERIFIGAPVIGRKFTFELTVTGGKSNKTLKVDACMLDPETMQVVGNRHFWDHSSLTNARRIARPTAGSPPHLQKTFGQSTGLIPVIYMRKPAGLKGFQYRIFFKESGKPKVARPQIIGSFQPRVGGAVRGLGN